MAVKAYTVDSPYKGVFVVTWSGLTNGDTGQPYIGSRPLNKCVQVTGTFGVGGSVNIEGSCMESSPIWAVLTNPAESVLTITAAKLDEILQSPFQYRPNVTAGDGTTSLTVTLVMSGKV